MYTSNQTSFHQSPDQNLILKCPKCGSVFIEDNICESCQYNLDFNPLGEPLGYKSYFELVKDYRDSKGPLLQAFPKLEKIIETPEKKELERKLLFRVDTLVRYLPEVFNEDDYKLYALELSEIFKELSKLGVPEELLLKKLEFSFEPNHPLFQNLTSDLLHSSRPDGSPIGYFIMRSTSLLFITALIMSGAYILMNI